MKGTFRISAALWAMLGVACLVPAPAMAAEPAWWTQQKQACGLPSNLAYNNWDGKCNRSTGGSVADPRVFQRQRYQAVLQMGVTDAAFGALPIATDDEFARALTLTYGALYRIAAVSKADQTYYSARSAEEIAMYKEFYTPRFSKIDASDGMDPDVRAENRKAKDEVASLTAEVRRLRALRERRQAANAQAARLRREAGISAKKRIAVYFGGLTKEEVEFWSEAMSNGVARGPCCDESQFPAPLYWSQGPSAPIGHMIAVAEASDAVDAAKNVQAPGLSGNNEARLALVESLAGQAATAVKSAEVARKRYQEDVQSSASGKKTWDQIREKQLMVMEETYTLTQRAIPAAKIEIKWAQDVFKGDVWEFFMNGGAAAAWSLFSKSILEPELKRVGIEVFHGNKYTLTDAEIAEAWKLDKHALFGAYKDYKKTKDIYALIKTAKNIEGTLEESALAVADVMGRADLGDYQEIGDKLFSGIDGAARKEVREALGQTSLPIPLKKFWEAYFTGVKPAFK